MAFDWCVAHAQAVGSVLTLLVALALGFWGQFGSDKGMR